MKFESKKYGPMTKSGIIRVLLFLVVLNLMVYYYDEAPAERLIYFSIAILGLFALTSILFPGKSVITIENSAVTFLSNGMVTANFDLNDVETVELSNDKCNRLLLVSTKDNLKFGMPTSGYSNEDIKNIIKALKKI